MIALLLVASVLDLAGYRARLAEIQARLEQGQGAQAEARALLQDTIRDGDETLAPDAYVLLPIAQGRPHLARLRALRQALGEAQAAPAAPPGTALLEEARKEQRIERPAQGGEVQPLEVTPPTVVEQLFDALLSALRTLWKWAGQLWDFLRGLFPDSALQRLGGAGQVVTLVLVGVGLILVLVLALAFFAARHRPPPAQPGSVQPGARDDDPVSRTASGWEERARELAREGRAREAIRAWYHALLVHLYAAGLLHYRRGRTNWEYAHALPSETPFRPRFHELTRSFDREWYGSAESTPGALQQFEDGTAEVLRALGRQP